MDQKPETPSLPPQLFQVISAAANSPLPSVRPDGTLDRSHRKAVDIRTPPNPTPIDGVTTHDVTIDSHRNLWFRVFVPDAGNSNKLPVIVYYHGGGFAFYSPDTKGFDELCRRFARLVPAVVVSANYRLIPEHRYPAQYEDGFEVLKFLDEDRNRIHLPENADLRSCFLAGDSAGGNIAHHVCKKASVCKFQLLKVIGVVALQPFFGGEERTASELSPQNSLGLTLNYTDHYWNMFKPLSMSSNDEWGRDNEVINVSGPRAADISRLDFPATLVVVGGRDILQDRQRKYYDWLIMSGKEAYLEEYPYMIHGFYSFTEVPEAWHVISVVSNFVHQQMNRCLE